MKATSNTISVTTSVSVVAGGSDINMPRMDGLEVCRRLRAGEVPIFFLSSRDDEIDRVLGIELGADDYVGTPAS